MIRPLTIFDAPKIAQIHFESLPNDFLPSFGISFLTILHKYLLQSSYSVGFGFFDRKQLVGFVIGSRDSGKLLPDTLHRGFLKLLPRIMKKILYTPSILLKLWETITYSKKTGNIHAELMIIAVKNTKQRKGIGSKLFVTLKNEFKKQHIKIFKVSTLAHVHRSNLFYKHLHGAYSSSFVLYGSKWNVYRFSI